MKTFTYLIICIALFLCSCKNNSFLTQRYTNFDHASRKSSVSKVETRKQPVYEVITTPAPIPGTKIVSVDKGIEQPVDLERPARENMHNPGLASKTFISNEHKTFIGDVRLSSERALKSAYEKATATKRGLIFGIINLALFIVICVLVVAGIVFLLTVLL
ncbi:MAG TPA: hypothetical protein VGF30_15650 [Bacteroidia bacterium]